MINNPIIYKFFKNFTNHREETNRAVVFSSRPLPYIQGRPMRPSNNLENKNLSETHSRVQLVRMKVQTHRSLEPPLEYKDQTHLMNKGSL